MKVGFVILHYKTLNDTLECVESLKKLDGFENNMVYIVDNFSNDGSGKKLSTIFAKYKNILLIKSPKNLGFAKGNNLGIGRAKSDNCDFVILLNNDVFIKQKDFVDRMIKSWDDYHFAIGGPRIISTMDGLDQNPFMVPRHFIKNKKMALKLFLLGLVKYLFVSLRLPLVWEKGRQSFNDGLAEERLNSNENDFLLNGAGIILSPTYFEKYNKLCEITFMYEEETIIYILSRLLNYRVEYIPNVLIYHKEQSSTKSIFGTEREKLIFGYREDFKSRYQILKLMMHENNKEYLENTIK